MDVETQKAVTRALDLSIADVALKEFQRLSDGMEPAEVAGKVNDSLRGLHGLQSGKMPNYDEWDAIFYATWYQPSQVNLAYMLATKLQTEGGVGSSEGGSLEVVDFGCGSLAIQFGMALAMADLAKESQPLLKVSVFSTDKSTSMMDFGWLLWERFREEIENTQVYSELGTLRQVCKEMNFDLPHQSDARRWLTVFHVAYHSEIKDIRTQLNQCVDLWKPNHVLVTGHPSAFSENRAYKPNIGTYAEPPRALYDDGSGIENGQFEKTREARREIRRLIEGYGGGHLSYLYNGPKWSPSYRPQWAHYVRRTA